MKKLQYNSPVILTFALLSLLSLLLGMVTGGASTRMLFCVYRSSPLNPLTYLRLFTHVLGHAGWTHYISNMLLLLVVGPPLEEKYGSKPLLLGIALTALLTGLTQIVLFPDTALLGASGVVFMMIVLTSFSGMKNGRIPLTFLLVVALYLGQEIFAGITQSDHVSQLTHILGGVTGGGLGFRLRKKKGGSA